MSFTEDDAGRNALYKKLTEDVEYINAKLESFNIKMAWASSDHFANSNPVNTFLGTNLNKLSSTKEYESERNIEDPMNSMTYKSTKRNRKKNMNLQNDISTPGSFETFSNLMERHCDSNNVDKDDLVVNNVDKSLLTKEVKNITELVDKHIQKLDKEVLPKFRTSKITSNIVQRNIDIPIKITPFQSNINEKSEQDTYVDDMNNSNQRSKSTSQGECTNFSNSSKNLRKIKNSQLISDSRRLPKSVKYCKNNVGTIHINAQESDEKEKDNCKLQNLTVNQSYRINFKPQLSTKKLDYFQIQPDNKQNVRNSKSNVAFREFTFGLEPETCKYQPFTQPGMINDKNAALSEICYILRRLMYDVLSNDSRNNYLTSQLQTIMTTLCETKTFELYGSKVLKDLVEEHSIVGFSEMFIKKKLIEIAEKMTDDQMTIEIENNCDNRVMNRVPTIKNEIYPKNHSMRFPDLPTDIQLNNKAMYANENSTNRYPNVTSHLKSYENISTTKYTSVRNFLFQTANNLSSSKKFKNSSSSHITLCLKECGIQSQSDLNNTNAENLLNSKNYKSPLKDNKLELKNKDQSLIKSLDKHKTSSELHTSNSMTELKTSLHLFENVSQNNNKENDYLKYEKKNNLEIPDGINNDCIRGNDEASLIKGNQSTKSEDNENSLSITIDDEHGSINNQIPVHKNVQPNLQEQISNSLLFTSLSANNYENTDVLKQFTANEIENSSDSTAFSMIETL